MTEFNLSVHEQNQLESIARDEALLSQEYHPYLPKTPEEAATFSLHVWVLEAMCRAYSMGRMAGVRRTREEIRNVLGLGVK